MSKTSPKRNDMDHKHETSYSAQRRYKRRKFITPVGLWIGGRFVIEKAVEVSEGGILLRVDAGADTPLRVGDMFELQFFLPRGNFISAQAEVVYLLEPDSGEHYVGFRFLNVPLRIQKLIQEFVEYGG
jgi:hypothetical protein